MFVCLKILKEGREMALAINFSLHLFLPLIMFTKITYQLYIDKIWGGGDIQFFLHCPIHLFLKLLQCHYVRF